MIGLIAGDFFGSIHENIPNQKKLTQQQFTDDSFLAFASNEWMKEIDILKYKHLYQQHKQFQSKEYVLFCSELESLAIKKLIKWHDIGVAYFKHKEVEIKAFSTGFSSWVATKKDKYNATFKSKNTNGCLMRNGPIPELALDFQLSLAQAIVLSAIFSKTTHNHPEALEAVQMHTALVYFAKQQVISIYNLKNALTTDNYSLLSIQNPISFSKLNIKPLSYWKDQSLQNKFILDAKDSLNIACSAIYYSKSFVEVLDFCNSTNMDCDTYGAIAGAIAEYIFPIPTHVKATIQEEMSVFHKTKHFF